MTYIPQYVSIQKAKPPVLVAEVIGLKGRWPFSF